MSKLRRDDGVELYFEVRGSGPVVLLTHGYGVTSQMWQPQFDALSKDNTLVVWDMRGHGRSDSPDDASLYSETKTTGDMAALLDHIGTEKAVIGGLSLGGYSTFAFYRDYPQRVAALIPMDCGPGYRNDEARADWNAFAEETAQRQLASSLHDVNADQARMGGHTSLTGLSLAARNALTQRDGSVMEVLPNIAVPTMLVLGDSDTNFVTPMEYMHRKVPGAFKLMVPASGHYPNIDHPEIVNPTLVWFLAGPARGGAVDWIGRGRAGRKVKRPAREPAAQG